MKTQLRKNVLISMTLSALIVTGTHFALASPAEAAGFGGHAMASHSFGHASVAHFPNRSLASKALVQHASFHHHHSHGCGGCQQSFGAPQSDGGFGGSAGDAVLSNLPGILGTVLTIIQ